MENREETNFRKSRRDSAAQKDTTATAGAKKSGNAAGVASPVARLSASKSNWDGGGGGLNLAR